MNNTLPISVIVPLVRNTLFTTVGLPALQANNVCEVIWDTGPGNANVRRNRAAAQATQPFLFFHDDDVILLPYALRRLHSLLDRSPPETTMAYCDFMVVNHPTITNQVRRPGPWDAERLKNENYISMMSLVKTAVFRAVGGMDEDLERFQDWDLWLRLAELGPGVYVQSKRQEPLFSALYVGGGITINDWQQTKAARQCILDKHQE